MSAASNRTESTFRKAVDFYGTVLARNARRGTIPYKAHLILTWKCQARCIMCNIWKRESPNELSLDEWSTFFKHNSFLKWLTFSGGEPFLRDDIFEIVSAAQQHCPGLFCINTPTNSLSPQKVLRTVEKLIALSIPRYVLSVSLDGPPAIHDRARGTPGAWDRAMQVLQGARELQKQNLKNFSVVLEHTLLPISYGMFSDMVRRVQDSVPDVTASDFMVTIGSSSQHYYGNFDDPPAEIQASSLSAAVRAIMSTRRNSRGLRLDYLLPQMYLNMATPYAEGGQRPPMRCRATRSTIFVTPTGTVYPCGTWNKVLGDLRKTDLSLKVILDRSDMKDIRTSIDQFKCGGCWTPCEALVSLAETAIRPSGCLRLLDAILSNSF